MEANAEGTPFGRYLLIEQLGHGGMGEVWRAHDTAIDRIVALKRLLPHFTQDQTYQQRFRREARAAARLDDPHVVPIYDVGEIDGRLYVTMRLIKGHDLQTLLDSGPLEPQRAVRIVSQVAAALHAAHKSGLVHRDVKPSNILLTEDDFAYLIDFGIARAAGETGLTSTGSTIGTWAYMAPERFKTGTADARTDVYALTCVLYECLTGHRPFPGENLEQIAAAHMFLPPPKPSALQAKLSEQMDHVIATGMAKEPYYRFATTKDLADAALAALAARGAASTQPPTESPGRRSKARATQQFSERWPNPEGTDCTPYRDHIEQTETPPLRRTFKKGPMLLTIGGVVMLTAALVAALWLIFSSHTESPAKPSGTPNAAPTQSTTPTTSHAARNSLPGTDSLGFVDYPGARCDPGTQPAVMARTTQSVLVVCQIQPGTSTIEVFVSATAPASNSQMQCGLPRASM